MLWQSVRQRRLFKLFTSSETRLLPHQPLVEKVAIFDGVQRARDENSLANFMKIKNGVDDFNQSEPEFLISIMNRHQD